MYIKVFPELYSIILKQPIMKKYTLFTLMVLFACSVNAQDKEHQIAKGLKEYQDLFNKSMNDSVSCYRIPAIVTAPNGDLVAAIDERVPSCGDLKWSNDINIVIRRSSGPWANLV